MTFVVVYDACVLYPAPLRDILIETAVSGLISAKWTRQIEAEWIRNLEKNRPDLSKELLQRTADLMSQAVPDALVENYASLIEGLSLPDADDRHVLAAAIAANAQVIVTFNLKDFPTTVLDEFGIEAVHPDTFLINQLDLSIGAVVSAIKKTRGRLKNPEKPPKNYIETLSSVGLPGFADRIKEYQELI
jgi:predicted nucleic acid-binding protein